VPQAASTRQSHNVSDFARARWIRRLWALDVCLAVAAAILIWFQFIVPLLPPARWIRYALTPFGLVFVYCLAEILITNLFSYPIERVMRGEHEGVLERARSAGEK
jgi:hypothetical protein